MNKLNIQPKNLSDLVADLGVYSADMIVTQICDDTRKLEAGDTFLCLPRVKDVAKIIQQAIDKQANAIVFVGEPMQQDAVPCACLPDMPSLGLMLRRWFETEHCKVPCIGTTGTDGKTSTAWMLRQVLAKHLGSAWSVGTLGFIKDDTQAEDLGNTTPSLLTLHHILAQATQQQIGALVLEVSSHGIAQSRIVGMPFTAAIWTTIGHDHIEAHGSYDTYVACKASFIRDVAASGGVVVANAAYADIQQALVDSSGQIYWYAHQQTAEMLWAVEDKQVILTNKQQEVALSDVPIADFHAENLAAVALMMQASFDVALSQFEVLTKVVSTPSGRLQAVGEQVYIDYAHTAEGLQRCLLSARKLTQGALLLVFGCGGNRDKAKRPEMGAVAVKHADKVWLTSDNPRDEQQVDIAQDVLQGIQDKTKVQVIESREEAIKQAVSALLPEDVLVIAGKGHETYMEIKGKRVPWSDKDKAQQALREVRLCA
ncbi:MAG TPA: UDP-N-acetylmuramoyl-L-alanyl-D-glutamate--2,6-diaminopimelate ligase [Mariprofundaceae bacterium]|nr:UDP-N-acetylmuramoyl-L-alanyl-D-glutamate--2,6-diaminopimelate ligase [Mariprofundaceae bacterium]